jgi:glycosyltransferase involved in cell wall biosynthesis
MDHLAAELGVRPRLLPTLRRELGPHDLRALAGLTRAIREIRPDVLHTHAAKAGALGRLAAVLAGPAGPRTRVHTFHGHVLSGYFSPRQEAVFTGIERALARTTTRLVAVSEEVRQDLIRLRIADPAKIEVIPLGFDLKPFRLAEAEVRVKRASTRARLGLPEDAYVVTLVARLVPIKRVDRFLRIAGRMAARDRVRFLVVGDGELHDELAASPAARRLGDRVTWAGLERDMPAIMCASDVVALTSDNEGTPVSLIEAQAAGLPVVSTDVGGVSSAVLNGSSARIVRPEDEEAFAVSLIGFLEDPESARRFGLRGRDHALAHFSIDRLVTDVDDIYRRLTSRSQQAV